MNGITKCVLSFRIRKNLNIYFFNHSLQFFLDETSNDLMDLSSDFTEFEDEMILYNSRKFRMNCKIFKQLGRDGKNYKVLDNAS